jgi:ribosome-binding protein aMBF1 (putative translation factor)
MERVCTICRAKEFETELFEGLYDDEIVFVCKDCARDEHIPIIRKPTPEQLVIPEQRTYSVRERMERLSGMSRSIPTKEQTIVRMNMSKLKMPEPKQSNPNVVDNYYWELNMARRRKKMTLNQLALQTQIPLEIIESIEKGKIPADFENIFGKLESYFGIKLLKNHEQKVNFSKTINKEEEILEEVRNKLNSKGVPVAKENLSKREQLQKLRRGEMDFIKKEEPKEDVTLNELIEIKRKKEKEEQRKKFQKQTEDLFGDDIELE